MEQSEYSLRLKELLGNYAKSKQMLETEFALSNNPYKIGDVFTDHIGSIRIDEIAVAATFGSNFPRCTYKGAELKKDGTPFKNGAWRIAYQSNEIN